MADDPKLLSLLGMCRRAGKLSCGHDGAIGSVRSLTQSCDLLELRFISAAEERDRA